MDVVRLERIVLEEIAFETIIHKVVYDQIADIVVR